MDDLPLELELQLSGCVASGGTLRQSQFKALVDRFPAWRRAFADWLRRFDARKQDGQASRRIGRYWLMSELGRGGMGVVHLAWDETAERWVAIKLLRSNWADEEMLRRFHREARALAQLRHPGVVPVHDIGSHEGNPFYAMELVVGSSLDRFVKDQQAAETTPDRLTGNDLTTFASKVGTASAHAFAESYPQAIATIGAKVADALHAAHEQGFVHRDIKPGNIMLCPDGSVRVLDFGLVRVGFAASLTQSADVLGSPMYLAPEQLRSAHTVDRRADIYSLGVTLYELLSLRAPFLSPTLEALYQQILRDEPAQVTFWNSRVARDLAAIVGKAMEKDRSNRYATMAQMRDDLQAYLNGAAVAARPVGAVTRLWRRTKRHKAAALSTAAAVIVLGVGAYFLVQMRGSIDAANVLAEIRGLPALAASEVAQWQQQAANLPEQERRTALQILAQHAEGARLLEELTGVTKPSAETKMQWEQRLAQMLPAYRLLAQQRLAQLEGLSLLDRVTRLDRALSAEDLTTTEQRAIETVPDHATEVRRRFAVYRPAAHANAELQGIAVLAGADLAMWRTRADAMPEVYAKVMRGLLDRHAEGLAFLEGLRAEDLPTLEVLRPKRDSASKLLPGYAERALPVLQQCERGAQMLGEIQSAVAAVRRASNEELGKWHKELRQVPAAYAQAGQPLFDRLVLLANASPGTDLVQLLGSKPGIPPIGKAAPNTGWQVVDGKRWPTRVLDERTGIVFALVPGGTLGSAQIQTFYLARTEVTFAHWQQGMGEPAKPGAEAAGSLPRPTGFREAEAFCRRFGYRLPTDLEWEHACRKGAQAEGVSLDKVANDRDSSQEAEWRRQIGETVDKVRPVGSLGEDALGLSDVLGNLWEWCDTATPDAAWQIAVGGAFDSYAEQCRADYRLAVDVATKDGKVGFRPMFVP